MNKFISQVQDGRRWYVFQENHQTIFCNICFQYVDENLSVMSIGFLLASPDDAVIWRGPKKNGMIKQFLGEVDWGSLDYLLIDTPPGFYLPQVMKH